MRIFRPWILGVLITLSIAGPYMLGPNVFTQLLDRLDFVIFDLRYRWVNPAEHVPRHAIVIVDVDEKSLKQEGRWPWSRALMRDLVTAVYNHGAAMVGMDIVFAESQRNPVDAILSDVDGLDEDTIDVLTSLRDRAAWDRALADSLRDDTVLGYFFYHRQGAASGVLPDPIMTGLSNRLAVSRVSSYSANIPVLQASALSAGYLTVLPDSDGVIRRAPMVLEHDGALYASLALEIVRQFTFSEQFALKTAEQGDALVLEGIEFDRYWVPTDAAGQVVIPFVKKRRGFPYLSASDVLRGKGSMDALDGAIVLIGTSAWGLGDLKTVPLAAQYPGVEVHANLINGLLNSQGGTSAFPLRPDLAHYVTVAMMLVMGFLLSGTLGRLSPVVLIIVSICVLFGVVGGNLYLWSAHRLDFPLAPLLVLAMVITAYFFSDSLLRENFQRRYIKKMFGQYVPPAHVDKMMSSNEQFSFAGESKMMTVMFCDIRNFTTISEGLTAANLKVLLNQFFTPITHIIFDNEGTVDKYVGDMVMAFWGAPLDDAIHAEHSVRAGLQMLQKVDDLKQEFARLGLPEITIGIGINTGLMNVGDMGSEYRRAYTVLGDAVNLGSRLEGVTKFYGVECLVGEQTQLWASAFHYRLIDRVRVKGKSDPVTVYEPVGEIEDIDSVRAEQIARFHMALFHYYYQQWDKAQAVLNSLQREAPEVLYERYQARIELLRHQVLPTEWDGVYDHKQK